MNLSELIEMSECDTVSRDNLSHPADTVGGILDNDVDIYFPAEMSCSPRPVLTAIPPLS